MFITHNFEQHIVKDIYNSGYRDLKILSGNVSPILVTKILDELPELNLKIYIGMVAQDGISEFTHLAFKHLVKRYDNRLEVHYQIAKPGQHSNVYYWENPLILGMDQKIFVGSATFTLNGFYHRNEILVEHDGDVEQLFNHLNLINCTSANVSDEVLIHHDKENELVVSYEGEQLDIFSITEDGELESYYESINIPLTIRGGETPPKSGINWGHNGRNGLRQPTRTGNEAYLSISKQVHRERPHFLPQRREKLLVLTDDGEMFVCKVAQEERKAIETCDSNSILGAYIRQRIGVALGTFVETRDLIRYGRDSLRLTKIHEGLYLLNFAADLTLANCEDHLWNIDDRGAEVLQENENIQIIIETVFVRVPNLNIDVYGGLLCSWDENSNEYSADSDLIIIKTLGTDDVVYDEGGSSLIVAVSNYCHSVGSESQMNYLESLGCEIIINN
ncbi:restriction endonuclease PLD domain-containing protein [Lysinibacillus xylanilyticus]|uniref:restriction endonuclease PLD domain-containing protein n=1 Tax=Lysinibacillus xylanilyticus TaxID=582475 RepID=UPI00381FA629